MQASQVHGFSPWSVSALGLSTAIVLVVSLAAAAQPAGRVLRIQPGEIVRSE
jgi:ABC-type antimicrobial peptide transport system permease subunit